MNRERWSQDWQGSNWIRRDLREAIRYRDGDQCVYCLAEPPVTSLDHVIPLALLTVPTRSKRGDNRPTNVLTTCPRCNSRKGDLDLDTWCGLVEAETGEPAEMVKARVEEHLARPIDREIGKARAAAQRGVE